MNRRGLAGLLLGALAILGGFAGGYLLFRDNKPAGGTPAPQSTEASGLSEAGGTPAPQSTQVSEPPDARGAPAPQKAQSTDWNTYHGGAAFTGAVEAGLPEQLALLWRFKAGAAVRQTPAVCDGLVFFATVKGEVIAIDLDGRRVWSRQLFSDEQGKDGPLRAQIEAPVACFDGLVIIATMEGAVHALDAASGIESWRAQLDTPVMGSPNYLKTDAGGRVFIVGRGDGALRCLDAATGAVLWQGEMIDRCDGSAAVGPHTIVYGSCAAALHVFSPDTGAHARDIELDADSQVAAGVALDGDWVVSGSRSGKVLQASTSTGQTAWVNTEIQAEVFTTPAITPARAVVAANDGTVYAFDRLSGKLVWRFEAGGIPASPVIAGNKVLAVAGGRLYMVALDDGRKLWEFEVSDEITGPAVASGRVLCGSEDGTLVAFGVAEPVEPAKGGTEAP